MNNIADYEDYLNELSPAQRMAEVLENQVLDQIEENSQETYLEACEEAREDYDAFIYEQREVERVMQ